MLSKIALQIYFSALQRFSVKQIQDAMGPEGKLISGYQKDLREARIRLRILDPTLDAWLYFFGTTDTFKSPEAEDIYNELVKTSLTPAIIGEAK